MALPAVTLADDRSGGPNVAPDARAKNLGERVDSWREKSEHGADWGRAIAVVDAPMDHVMKIVTDYDHYSEFLPHFKVSKVLSRRGDDALVYLEVGIIKNTTTLWGQLKLKSSTDAKQKRTITAKVTKGNMTQFAATWEVTPLDGGKRTLVDFRILVEPKLPLPSAVFSAENEKAAARSLKAVRKRVRGPAAKH